MAILKRIVQDGVPDLGPRLSRDDANRVRDAHAVAFPETPSLARLMELGVLAQVDGGLELLLEGRAGAWGVSLVRAAALLWEEGLRAGRSGRTWLRAWLDRVETIGNWANAPSAMLREARDCFLDAAMEVLLAEPDLARSWQDEELRLCMEQDNPFEILRRIPSGFPPPPTPLARYRRYEHCFRYLKSLHGLRHELIALMGAIVRNDSFAGPPNERCRRIRQLIRAGDKSP